MDYGLIAALSIFMSIAMNLTESGFADFLISKQDSSNEDFAIVFTHNVAFGVFCYLLLYVSAPWIAEFYKSTELISIARILGLSIVLKALCISEVTRMRKELQFRKIALMQLSSSLIALIVGYLMAFYGCGYWALVGQTVILAFSQVLYIILLNKWRPVFHFNWQRYKQMRGFANNILLSFFTNQLGANMYSVFIGKFHNPLSLGYFYQAERVNQISFQSVNSIVLTTSYSLLAKENDSNERRKKYNQLLDKFLFIHLSISFFTIGSAYSIIKLLFGTKWMATAPLLQLTIISFILTPLVTVNANITKIENKTNVYRNLTFIRNGLLFIALLITYRYSLQIILIGLIVARILSAILDVFICGKYVSFYPSTQFLLFFKQVYSPLLAAAASYLSIYYWGGSNNFLNLGIYFITFGVIFFSINYISKNATFFYFINNIQNKFKKR